MAIPYLTAAMAVAILVLAALFGPRQLRRHRRRRARRRYLQSIIEIPVERSEDA